MLVLFLVLVMIFTYTKTVTYGDMHKRYINKMSVYSDLDPESAEVLMIYMALISITAFSIIILGRVGILPNVF